MKIVFAGSPEYAVPSLEALHAKYGVCAVITQPDKPVGRKNILTPTPAFNRRSSELLLVGSMESARFAFAQIQGRGAHSVGDTCRRNPHGRYGNAHRTCSRYGRYPAR